MNLIVDRLRNWYQKVLLEIFGWCKINDRYYIICPTHGFTTAHLIGFYNTLLCVSCASELNQSNINLLNPEVTPNL
jgi:hypothetical protein